MEEGLKRSGQKWVLVSLLWAFLLAGERSQVLLLEPRSRRQEKYIFQWVSRWGVGQEGEGDIFNLRSLRSLLRGKGFCCLGAWEMWRRLKTSFLITQEESVFGRWPVHTVWQTWYWSFCKSTTTIFPFSHVAGENWCNFMFTWNYTSYKGPQACWYLGVRTWSFALMFLAAFMKH